MIEAPGLPPTPPKGRVNMRHFQPSEALCAFISNSFQLCNPISIEFQSLFMPGAQNSSCKMPAAQQGACFSSS